MNICHTREIDRFPAISTGSLERDLGPGLQVGQDKNKAAPSRRWSGAKILKGEAVSSRFDAIALSDNTYARNRVLVLVTPYLEIGIGRLERSRDGLESRDPRPLF